MKISYVLISAILLIFPLIIGGSSRGISMYQKLIPVTAIITAVLIAVSAAGGKLSIPVTSGTSTVARIIGKISAGIENIAEHATIFMLTYFIMSVLLVLTQWIYRTAKKRR